VASRRTLIYQILSFVALIVGYILFAYVLWLYLDWYIAPDNATDPSTAKKDLFQALGFILAGTAGVVGIYFTWRNLSISQATLQSTREAQALEREGQAVERFGNAVELLGAADDKGGKKIEARVAGIYTLEGIAKGSPDQLAVIANIMNSYIRNNAPNRSKWEVEADSAPTSLNSLEPSQDVQVGISALSKLTALIQERTPGAPSIDFSIDLSNTALQSVRLADAFLVGANFERALLTRADFARVDLQEANLQGSNLRGANLQEANLQRANLQRANLQEAKLQEANLQRANLQRTNLDETNLQGANFRGAIITDEQLADTLSLQGTTMPNGQNYEDWLKSRG
jgi:hypothetical protein